MGFQLIQKLSILSDSECLKLGMAAAVTFLFQY